MQNNSKFQLRNLWDGRIAVVALSVAGVLFAQAPPLENNRLPTGEPQQFMKDAVFGRSWQDPLAAVERHRIESRKSSSAPEEPPASIEHIDSIFPKGVTEERLPDDKKPKPPAESPVFDQAEVLAVMIPDGILSEDGETRRRIRYAVVMGLDAKHLVTNEPDRLQYFLWPPRSVGHESVPIAYEWYLPPSAERRSKDSPKRPVLVLWLRESAFSGRSPLANLEELKKQFSTRTAKTWRVIGPTRSDSLKRLVDEVAAKERKDSKSQELDYRLYSPFATAPDAILLDDIDGVDRPQSLQDLFKRQHISFIRTIGTDRPVANALIDELELRGQVPVPFRAGDAGASASDLCTPTASNPHPKVRHIAVLAERDTVYGRSVLRELAEGGKARHYCVDSFDYLRGLDGELPMDGDISPKPSPAGAAGTGSKTAPSPPNERAAGQQQFDYLRRLTDDLRRLDTRIRERDPEGGGLRAIGVLGTDVHDKLLVLQALKPEFPNAVFFTTDLDSRFLNPREQDWARNLVVAASYGFTLSPEFQGGAPPFRDTYQTAVYVSTMLAIDEGRLVTTDESASAEKMLQQQAADKWFEVPRTYEIGRTSAFGFRTGLPGRFKGECGWKLIGCENLHPAGSAYFVPGMQLSVYIVFFLVVSCLWVVPVCLFEDSRNAIQRKLAPNGSTSSWSTRLAIAASLFLLLQVGLPMFLAWQWSSIATWITTDGSPLLAFEGISPWPAEAIRLVAIVVGVLLIVWSRYRLSKNWKEIDHEFDTTVAADKGTARAAAQEPTHGMVTLWKTFGRHSDSWRTVVALLAAASLVVLVGGLLVSAFGGGELPLTRGMLSRSVHEALRWLVQLTLTAVVIWVVGHVVACVLLIGRLPKDVPSWPEAYLRQGLDLTEKVQVDLAQLKFIARRTSSIAILVYFPFIIPSLLLVSTVSFLGSPHVPIGPVLLALVGTAITVFCAWKLNDAAEAVRTRTLSDINDALVAAEEAGDSKLGSRLQRIRAQVLDLSDGAFAPFWQQTMFNALLIPFAAVGSSSLLQAWLTRLAGGA